MIRLALVVMASLASFGAFARAPELAQEDETLQWLDDYDEAMALAKETGKPVFLEFRCVP